MIIAFYEFCTDKIEKSQSRFISAVKHICQKLPVISTLKTEHLDFIREQTHLKMISVVKHLNKIALMIISAASISISF